MIKIDNYSHESKQQEVSIKQFLRFSKCNDYNELINLNYDNIQLILSDWEELLRTGMNRTYNTIQAKLWHIQIFLSANDINFRFPDDSIYENYSSPFR